MENLLSLYKKYGVLGTFHICISFLYTKLFFRDSRLIRLPFDIRNRKNIKLGKNFTSGKGCRLEAYYSGDELSYKCIEIGENVQINDYVHISAISSIKIDNNVLIASKVFISDHNHGSYSESFQDSPEVPPIKRELKSKSIWIQENVWIGENVSVLPGCKIGKGSIIGANSIIVKDIPDYSIVVGNPGRIIKRFDNISKTWRSIS